MPDPSVGPVGGARTTIPSGAAVAYGPAGHDRAIDSALKTQLAPHFLSLLRKAVMSSDQRPYWSDGPAHCDEFDQLSYPHDYRVREFEHNTAGNVRKDTKAEIRRRGKHYSSFPAPVGGAMHGRLRTGTCSAASSTPSTA